MCRKSESPQIVIGGEEVAWNPAFRLIMHFKHYVPEDQPELRGLRVVDFNVTPEGLEEQLLSLVVSRAAADVERKKQDILFCQYQ
ncbi:Dynein beta chain [Diplonema papillatum]|nr:Dynein beta chain [Diplonema papillatum]